MVARRYPASARTLRGMEERTETVRRPLRDLRALFAGPEPVAPARPASRRWLRWQRWLLPAGVLALLGLAVAAVTYLQDTRQLNEPAAILIAVGSVVPVALVVRRPLLAWRIAYLMLFVGAVRARPDEAYPWNPVQIIAFLVVLVALAIRVEIGVVVWAGLLSLLPVYLFIDTLANAYGITVLVTIILLLGDQVRRRRKTQRALVEQAEQSELEKARRAVLEERTRIARELHDVVAHHMSMIAVQAETAPYRLAALPEPARSEFTAIADSARGALTEMRRLLGVLRSESTAPETAPQPGLADVPALVEAARRAGMTVALELGELATEARPPEPVGLAAYRIVQEALANAARHAAGAPVRVALGPTGRTLHLRVENGGGRPAGPDQPDGHGLTGMRERARLLGGAFRAGPTEDGFAVVARLPYDVPEDGDG